MARFAAGSRFIRNFSRRERNTSNHIAPLSKQGSNNLKDMP
jgi:hypothetical protein